MIPDGVRVTARTVRTERGTTHTVYEVDGREFHDADSLQAYLDGGTGQPHSSQQLDAIA